MGGHRHAQQLGTNPHPPLSLPKGGATKALTPFPFHSISLQLTIKRLATFIAQKFLDCIRIMQLL